MPPTPTHISYRNRQTDDLVEEKVPHASILRFLYGSILGNLARRCVCARRWFSGLYRRILCNGKASCSRIAPFARDHGIDLQLFEPGPFANFNEFFVRRFRDGVRSFQGEPTSLPAWAEGVCLAWRQVESTQALPVKTEHLTAAALMGDDVRATPFCNGPAVIIRLRPPDYHRFHFVDEGPILDQWTIPGALDSVNPLALRQRPDILSRNERHVTLQQSKHFGLLAYIEVGAMAVGRIVQCSTEGRRGDEKGWFEFGGSTVALFGVAGAWTPDEDLLQWTEKGVETFLELGTAIATADAPGGTSSRSETES